MSRRHVLIHIIVRKKILDLMLQDEWKYELKTKTQKKKKKENEFPREVEKRKRKNVKGTERTSRSLLQWFFIICVNKKAGAPLGPTCFEMAFKNPQRFIVCVCNNRVPFSPLKWFFPPISFTVSSRMKRLFSFEWINVFLDVVICGLILWKVSTDI